MGTKQETDQRILLAFSELLLKYGYRGTTTRKLATRAGVNESTIFRHFQDKRHLLEQLITGYLADIDRIGEVFQMSGDVVFDLQRIAELYIDFVRQHQSIFLLDLRESYQFAEVRRIAEKLPLRLRESLTGTFHKMVASGEMAADVNVSQEVDNFILINFGNAVFRSLYPHGGIGIVRRQFLRENVRTFAQHLRPREI
ncbi:TetR/AcrR family transcriptional regulator [Levilactobacillus suantsaii]|uniref:TetR/AcrR family transcriptional regulator n=1 Tax=Levilactobacillus suantsaii TaxID=2292255 RepID=A0A4Q0VL85_9LACO|nr:TetR/AcrR family transcriptional regulator [Levilactobacillus suantsaii]QMU08220.1 TetR/AcrR family transcriptional regulator [Levilactobacillus suantsaii]RXI79129.1 TetR/AcrR family transcriptional regulator [Levilactobacillus suantsaii]